MLIRSSFDGILAANDLQDTAKLNKLIKMVDDTGKAEKVMAEFRERQAKWLKVGK